MIRRPMIAGNWKMHKTIAEGLAYVRELRSFVLPNDVDAVICPPFTALAAVSKELRALGVALGAQTMSEADHGPQTGEISPVMLREIGVSYVVLGHSERRQYFGETDAMVAVKARSALTHGLTPIIAVGDTAQEHAAGLAPTRVIEQTQAAIAGIPREAIGACIFAYEPIWAIGTGLSEDPDQADALMGQLRASVPELRDARLLYGGSMNTKNAASIMAQPNIDGGLIGGASLSPANFAELLALAHAALEAAR
ncbi:MAG TPA: triose-phosphate isomerase [Candidatus Baltobacteraceae bacterium]